MQYFTSLASCPAPTPDQKQLIQQNFQTVVWHGMFMAILSIIGSLSIFVTYICFKLYRISSFRVIILLCFADFIQAIQALLMGADQSNLFDKDRCLAQGFLNNLSNLCQLGWTFVMAYILYQQNIKKKLANQIFTCKTWAFYFTVGAILPTILSIIPFSGGYSPDTYYCWVTIPGSTIMCDPRHKTVYTNYHDSSAYAFIISLYSIVWITIAINLALYMSMICYRQKNMAQIRKSINSRQSEEETSSYHLLIFPIAQILIWFFPTINRLVSLATNGEQNRLLSILHLISMNSSGIVNAIIYGFNPLVKLRISEWVKIRKRRNAIDHEEQQQIQLRQEERLLNNNSNSNEKDEFLRQFEED